LWLDLAQLEVCAARMGDQSALIRLEQYLETVSQVLAPGRGGRRPELRAELERKVFLGAVDLARKHGSSLTLKLVAASLSYSEPGLRKALGGRWLPIKHEAIARAASFGSKSSDLAA
jgi:hypothetical protein